jgi:hypothetical protein
MKTPHEISAGDIRMPDPEKFEARKARVIADVADLREALKEWLPQKVRDVAKEIAVAQTDVTLALAKEKMTALKRAIDEYCSGCGPSIDDEFTVLRFADVRDVSSGQIAALLERRIDAGLRRLLAGLNPILQKHGYRKDHLFFEGADVRVPGLLDRRPEVPADVLNLLRDIAETLIELKSDEAKVAVLDRRRARKLAEEMWENA